jgi:hypothetical protein
MPVNAVAFAVTCLLFGSSDVAVRTNLTELVNFAFATSGISCGDKMRKFNSERFLLVEDVDAAVDYYNKLAGTAGAQCNYFPGICELLKKLHERGVRNFITSAVEQSVLDDWARSAQAASVVPYLTEILGNRGNGFAKGRSHFEYLHLHYHVNKIIYVADAVAEIATGVQLSRELSITPIGFAHHITAAQVQHALQLVIDANKSLADSKPFSPLEIIDGKLELPNQEALMELLKTAGASEVVGGNADNLVARLTSRMREVLE